MSSFQEIINVKKPVLVDFHATWCGPCQVLAPILKEIKHEMGDKISIIKIDIDKNMELASKYQVRGVPTMILFLSGKQVWRKSGVVAKQELMSSINGVTNKSNTDDNNIEN